MKSHLGLKKYERLRHSQRFSEIYLGGRRLKGPHLSLFFMPNQLAYTRLGLAVPKKRFKSSTERHYLLRRLREAYRRNKPLFLPGYDLIINAHSFNQTKIHFATMQKEFLFLAQKAHLLHLET